MQKEKVLLAELQNSTVREEYNTSQRVPKYSIAKFGSGFGILSAHVHTCNTSTELHDNFLLPAQP